MTGLGCGVRRGLRRGGWWFCGPPLCSAIARVCCEVAASWWRWVRHAVVLWCCSAVTLPGCPSAPVWYRMARGVSALILGMHGTVSARSVRVVGGWRFALTPGLFSALGVESCHARQAAVAGWVGALGFSVHDGDRRPVRHVAEAPPVLDHVPGGAGCFVRGKRPGFPSRRRRLVGRSRRLRCGCG